MRSRNLAIRGAHSFSTLYTYLWRANYTPYIKNSEFMKKVRSVLTSHKELDDIWGKDVGNDPSKIFYTHTVSEWVEDERVSGMLDRGIAVVKPGSGIGRQDGFYTYVQMGLGSGSKPYASFRCVETLNSLIDIFLDRNPSKTQLVFRSPDEVAEIKPHGMLNMGVFTRPLTDDYEHPISTEVAFVRKKGSNTVQVVSKDAAKAYIKGLLSGILAIESGILIWINELELKGIESHQDFVNALIEKFRELDPSIESTSPIQKIADELNTTLRNLYSALTVASDIALLIGETESSEELLAVRDTLGLESPPKSSNVKTEIYHTHHASHHHHHHKNTQKHQ